MRPWKIQAISLWLYFPHHIIEMCQWPTSSDTGTCCPLKILLVSGLECSSLVGAGLTPCHWQEQKKVGERFHSCLTTLLWHPLPATSGALPFLGVKGPCVYSFFILGIWRRECLMTPDANDRDVTRWQKVHDNLFKTTLNYGCKLPWLFLSGIYLFIERAKFIPRFIFQFFHSTIYHDF